ncbi:hypothetical protein, partial [Pseudanabaena sp. FACHB-1998]|uniref:hypothetical protein n=1 Tax=Pseudanabaena sp. FACHB-1998 TaxID=2692858 RepID=UPI001A7F102D
NSSSNSLRIFIGFCVSYCVARLSLCIHPRLYTFHFTLSDQERKSLDYRTPYEVFFASSETVALHP